MRILKNKSYEYSMARNYQNQMKICLFGSYVKDSYGIPSGNGGTLLKKILEMQNVEVIECHEPIAKFSSILTAYLKLFFRHRKISYDVLVIPWRGRSEERRVGKECRSRWS